MTLFHLLLSSLVISVVGVSSEQCSVLQEYTNSYPQGKVKVDGLHIISNNVSLNECLTLCCHEGPTLCQYMWLFEGHCVGMPCLTNKTACSPQTVNGLPSTMIAVKYDSVNSTAPEPTAVKHPVYDELVSQLMSNSLNHINVTTASHVLSTSSSAMLVNVASSSPSHNVKSTSYPLIIMSSGAGSEKTSNIIATPLPTSNAGHSSKVITVATDAINRTKEITLPTNSVKIFASTWPKLSKGVKYSWQWSQVLGPSKGFLSVIGDTEASLTGLVEGVYVIKVLVTGDDGSRGETSVNVTVHSAPRVNTPPQPVITPSNHLLLHLPTDSAILEATSSTDDYEADKMTFKWEEISGPLGTLMDPSFEQVLYLKSLVAGTYVIKLTATDVDGASNFTTANITVLPSVDNPPIANAGSAKKLVWPHNHVLLYGNASFDDNGIVSYKWQKSVGPIVDMQGSSTAILELSNLEIGDYVFILTVTDKSDQHSSAEVSVAVVEEANKPPIANAGTNKDVKWPVDSVLLDGSSSNDDQDITGYCWTLVKPSAGDIVIEAPHAIRTNVTRLRVRGKSPTVYEFNLTVTDQHNLTSWDTVLVTVTKAATVPPTIVVQLLMIVSLPQHIVILNASKSYDDFGITGYQWTPFPQNLVIGEMVDGSTDSSVLFFMNFVEGVYLFNLTVHNKYNAWSSTVVNVTVLPDVHEENLVQLYLSDDDSASLTLVKLNLLKEMIRNELGVDSKITIQDTRQLLPRTVVEFYVVNSVTGKPYMASYIVQRLDKSSVFKKLNDEFSIMGIETKVCQADCSGHGSCDYHTKTCKCNLGWMPNPFRREHGKKGLNCDWSVLYVVLILLAPVLLMAILVWIICCCCYRRQKRSVSSRRVRYALLQEDSSNGKSSRHTVNSSSIMVSETETEEEIMFDKMSKKKLNNSLDKYGPNELINPAKLQ